MLNQIQKSFRKLQRALNKFNCAYLWDDYKLNEGVDEKNVAQAIEHLVDLYIEMLKIYYNAPDSIFVADRNGVVKYLNKSTTNYSSQDISALGCNASDLEKEGLFRPSAIRLALEEKSEVSIYQKVGFSDIDFIVKAVPVLNEQQEVDIVITSARSIPEIEKIYQYHQNNSAKAFKNKVKPFLSGTAPAVLEILDIVDRIKDTDSTILINGESGVGKGVLARYIHDNSNRAAQPMIEINCGAIPKDLIESELFGYEGGAFTGASAKGKEGLFELAHGGTLLLDEISETPPALQVKLLKVIQDKQILRIGGKQLIDVDVRIIAASNKNLVEQIKKGEFRRDLYYRINVIPLTIPPLRERKADIVTFADFFLEQCARRYSKTIRISKQCYKQMEKYRWPGNIRELENCIERMVLISKSDVIETMDVTELAEMDMEEIMEMAETRNMNLSEALDEFERRLVTAAYQKYQSSYKISEILGISQTSANRKIRKYLSDDPDGRSVE